MCLSLSLGSQMLPPAKLVKATTYRRSNSTYCASSIMLCVATVYAAERDMFAIAKLLFF